MGAETCMEFLGRKRRPEPPGLAVAFGDSSLLRREAVAAFRTWVLGDAPSEFAYSVYDAPANASAEIFDELYTAPFIGDRRLVVVENADGFVSGNRQSLEKLAVKPSPVGVLLLSTSSFMATTRLAKVVPLAIDCKTPKEHYIPSWIIKWAKVRYEKDLDEYSAKWLVDLVGADLGVLDQELSKLRTVTGDSAKIERKDIETHVAGARVEDMFKILDAALGGDISLALAKFDRLVHSGEHPVKMIAMMMPQLRRFAEAGRAMETGVDAESAMTAAGAHPYFAKASADRLRKFGKVRLSRLYRRLLQSDLDLKGGTSLSARTVLERLLIFVSQ